MLTVVRRSLDSALAVLVVSRNVDMARRNSYSSRSNRKKNYLYVNIKEPKHGVNSIP